MGPGHIHRLSPLYDDGAVLLEVAGQTGQPGVLAFRWDAPLEAPRLVPVPG